MALSKWEVCLSPLTKQGRAHGILEIVENRWQTGQQESSQRRETGPWSSRGFLSACVSVGLAGERPGHITCTRLHPFSGNSSHTWDQYSSTGYYQLIWVGFVHMIIKSTQNQKAGYSIRNAQNIWARSLLLLLMNMLAFQHQQRETSINSGCVSP